MSDDPIKLTDSQEKALLGALLHKSESGIFVVDEEGIIIYANSAAKVNFKYLDQALVGSRFGIPVFKEATEYCLLDEKQSIFDMQVEDIDFGGKKVFLVSMRDVTEREKARAALKKQSKLLLVTGKVAHVGSWRFNLDTEEVWWSEVCREIHGVSEDFDPSKEDTERFFPGGASETLLSSVYRAAEEGTAFDLELPFLTAQGEHLWVRTIGEPVYDNGRVVALEGTFQDITHQHQNQIKLQDSEQRFRQLFEHAINGFVLGDVIYDEDGEPINYLITEVNQAFEEILGIRKEDAVGSLASEIITDLTNAPIWDALAKVARTGEAQRVEFYSSVFDHHLIVSLYQPVKGQIASIFSDISDRVEAETALQASEKKFRQLFENSISAYALHQIILDEDGNPVDFLILDVNDAFEENIGLKAEDVIGMRGTDLGKNFEGLELVEYYNKIVLSGEPIRVELYEPLLKRHLLISAFSPEAGQLATVISDITERVAAEEAIRYSERRYRLLFEQSLYGFVLVEMLYDPQGNPVDFVMLETNTAFDKMGGFASKELIGKKISEIEPRLLETEIIKTFDEVAKTGVPRQYDVEVPGYDLNLLISSYSPIEGQVASILLDVTEKVQSERELRISEEKFRLLYESMTQGVIYHTAEAEIILVNPAAERILGIPASELIGKSPLDPELQMVRANGTPLPNEKHPAVVALQTGQKVENYVFGIPNIQRKEFTWIEVSAIPLFREGEDKPYQAFTTFLDITNRVRAQHALEERIKELRCLSRISSVLQEKSLLNEIFPLVAKEIVAGMRFPHSTIVRLELEDKVFYSEEPFIATPYELSAPIWIRDQSLGEVSVFYKENRPFLIPEEQNLLEAIAERLSLWHQQNETQKRLKESERWFRNAIMLAPNPIMIHSVSGDVIEVNDAWLETTGYQRDEIDTVEKWVRMAHPDRHDEIQQMIEGNFSGETVTTDTQYPVLAKDGRQFQWYFSSAPLGKLPDGQQIVITIAIDITERVAAEEGQQQYLNRIVAMREIDQLMVSTLELDKVLDQITSNMENVIQFDAMSVLMLDGDYLQMIACRGFENPEEILTLRFPSTPDYPNYKVIENKEPVMVMDVSEEYPKFLQPGNFHLEKDIKTWLGVPLVNKDEVIGMFTIDRMESTPFSEMDIEVAMQYANRAAIAITNARLYEQTKDNLEKLGILRAVDNAITGSRDLGEVSDIILEQIQIALGIDVAAIYQYEEETDSLVYVRSRGFHTEGKTDIKVKMGQGYIGTIAETRQPKFVPEVKWNEEGKKFPFNFENEGIISYYGFPLILKDSLQGVLELIHRSRLEPEGDWVHFAETLARQTAIAVDNLTLFADLEKANKELREAYDATIEGWAHALEIRDKETEGHSRRVGKLTVAIAEEYGFSEEQLVHVRRGVLLHDIGKMGVPDQILHKPGPLDDAEWEIMRQHPDYAYDMLKSIDYLKPALNIPHYHHERWDGSGYPEGLKGEAIPLEARIFAVVDAWDALTSDRPYRKAWSEKKTKKYLKEMAGKEFDPNVVKILLRLVNQA